ncbi:MAG: ATP-binding protein [Parvularculaceae bacterium]
MGVFHLGSVRRRLFLAVAALCAVFSCYALWSVSSIDRASEIVKNTYDRPLQSLNHARAANATFYRARMAALAGETARVEANAELFLEDLDIARERALSDEARNQIAEIEAHFQIWRTTAPDDPGAPAERAAADEMSARFDVLSETMAADSFLERQRSVDAVNASRRFAIASTIGALILALGVAILLTRQIVRPLSLAASVADRISEGDLLVEIPEGRSDETGALLRSMRFMQDSIKSTLKREEARAASAEARMVDALDQANAAIVLLSTDGAVAFANAQMTTYFPVLTDRPAAGSDFAAPLGRIVASLTNDEAHDPKVVMGLSDTDEFRLDDGRWLRVARAETRQSEAIVIWTDITALKEREDRLRIATAQAEAARAAKSRFLTSVTHELYTPLNAIMGLSELMETEAFGPLGSAYKEHAKHIGDGGRRLLDLITEVLEIADDAEAATGSEKTSVDVVSLLAKIADDAREATPGAAIAYDRSTDPVWVWGERDGLAHALRNIVSNAVKFADGPAAASIAVSRDDAFVEIVIEDKGVGMRPEDIPRALSAFDQVEGGYERKYDGAGAGLPYAKSVIDRHGGTLAIESALGEGTRVRVRLPDAASVAYGSLSIPAKGAASSA